MNVMQKVVLATSNAGKVAELAATLAQFGFDVTAQSTLGVKDVEETGLTFIENALIKARNASEVTGLPAIADDSGLAVDHLGGAPGIYSARYAGPGATDRRNLDKLLLALKDLPAESRGANFHCVLVYMRHPRDPVPLICHGVWRGAITMTPFGTGGFGYDPVFYVPELQCTAAQLAPEEKQTFSHRGQALRQLLAALRHA